MLLNKIMAAPKDAIMSCPWPVRQAIDTLRALDPPDPEAVIAELIAAGKAFLTAKVRWEIARAGSIGGVSERDELDNKAGAAEMRYSDAVRDARKLGAKP
jgi:hypothetical protein